MNPSADASDVPVRQLYENRAYPDMSHPQVDPALIAVSAALGGLTPPPPSRARILEIGCAAGHNLLPLALRWPDSRFIGVDFAPGAIATAKRRASALGIVNISFEHADLRHYSPEGCFDYIIAHGFLSWVPDDVKAALFSFCQSRLAPNGVAVISFNLTSGWSQRRPIIDLVRHLGEAMDCDESTILAQLLAATPPGVPGAENTRWILSDMLAKGPEILAFDDFGPLNDPWDLEQFLAAAKHFGLTWIGEADPADNIPAALDASSREQLAALAADPVKFHMAADALTARTFRACLLRRSDAPAQAGFTSRALLDFSYRAGKNPPPAEHPAAPLHHALTALGPQCHPASALADAFPELSPPQLARLLMDGITAGIIRPRTEPTPFSQQPSAFPRLDPLRLLCARERLPLPDAFQVPCSFPSTHYAILTEMTGRLSRHELAARAREIAPDLDFSPWLTHLASRGLLC